MTRRVASVHPHPAPTPDHGSLTRWEAVTLSQLRTVTSPLTWDNLLKIGLAANEQCPACGEPDSAAHLLLNCPAYEMARRRHWGVDPSLADVLGGPAAANIIGYLRGVGWTDPPVDPLRESVVQENEKCSVTSACGLVTTHVKNLSSEKSSFGPGQYYIFSLSCWVLYISRSTKLL